MTAPQYPSPFPVLTLLLGSAVAAAVGIILLARSDVPAVGGVLLAAGVVGVLVGLVMAVRNVRIARRVAGKRSK